VSQSDAVKLKDSERWKPSRSSLKLRRFICQIAQDGRYVPDHFYELREHRLAFAEYLGEQLKYNRISDWYGLTRQQVHGYQGAMLLRRYYDGSVIAFVTDLIRNSSGWHPWLFAKTPKKFWKSFHNRHAFFCWLSEDIGLSQLPPEAWYEVKFEVFSRPEVKAMLKACYDGPSRYLLFLKEMYPDVKWRPWLFQNLRVYGDYWGRRENRIEFIKWYTNTFLDKITDWEREPANLIIRRLKYRPFRKRPLIEWLKEAYPEVVWHDWCLRAGGVPDGFWKIKRNRLACLKWLEEK
jgi:hypothetical protein